MNIAQLGLFEQTALARIATAAQNAGLGLTDGQIRRIAATEQACLSEMRRVSFSQSAAARIIEAFSTSDFLFGAFLDETLADIIESFYDLRADFSASVTDDEIIEAFQDAFDGEAAGCIDEARELTRGQIRHEQTQLAYEIVDDNGNVYRWDPTEWTDNVQANGWDGERWDDEL